MGTKLVVQNNIKTSFQFEMVVHRSKFLQKLNSIQNKQRKPEKLTKPTKIASGAVKLIR